MMLSDIFYFLLLFLIFGHSESAYCERKSYEKWIVCGIIPMFLFYAMQTSVNKGCFSSHNSCISGAEDRSVCVFTPTVTYDVDVVYGIANASFALPPLNCCYTGYKVILIYYEKNDNESCSEDYKAYKMHSERCYYIWKCEGENCVDDKCDQNGKVAFRYVFSGCYKLQIKPYIRSSTRASLYSKATYIESNYTKENVDELVPYVGPTYRAKEKIYNLGVSYPQPISFSRIELNFSENDTRVGGAEVKAGIQDSKSSSCRKIKNITEPTFMVFKEVNCMFYNVTPGNYSLRISMEDDRCQAGTIWTSTSNPCRWRLILEINHQPTDQPFVSIYSTSNIAISVAIIIAILLLLAGLVYWLFKRRRSSWGSRSVETPDEVLRPMMHKMKVLLLYPRDCKDFMNVMESFRKVLEKFHNVEVFDCYTNEEVLNGPLAWLQSLMSQPRLCTIIVTSHCAYLQQKALKSGHNTNSYSIYKEPTFLDTLFIFGLKLIMEDVSPDIYHKSYVIGFNGFSENSNMLSLPTSFRRYIIPDHLGKLLSDMKVKNSDENFHVLHSPEYIALQNSITSLLEYKSKNLHYLENLLNLM